MPPDVPSRERRVSDTGGRTRPASATPAPPRTHRVRGQKRVRLPTIEGILPDLRSPLAGCRFQARCPEVMDRCRTESPELVAVDDTSGSEASLARCFAVEERRGAA